MTITDLSECKAVVIGGGTGAPQSIKALLSLGVQTSAVVAMADDGGSTGILRQRAGAIPPGDIRKCLVAMSNHPDSPLARAFQYRFDYADNHALGNLILTALSDTAGSFPSAIAICEHMLQCRGHVYPSTLDSIVLSGITRDGVKLVGQANVSASRTALDRVWLEGAPGAYPPAVKAILDADLIVLGPGSLFTSIIPNLLVPQIIEAIRKSPARTVFVCSLADMQGETWGLDVAEHVEALLDHGMRGRLDVVIIHRTAEQRDQVRQHTPTMHFSVVTGEELGADTRFTAEVPSKHAGRLPEKVQIRRVPVTPALIARIESQGPVCLCRDMADPLRPTWHDPALLADVFKGVLATGSRACAGRGGGLPCPSPPRSKTSCPASRDAIARRSSRSWPH